MVFVREISFYLSEESLLCLLMVNKNPSAGNISITVQVQKCSRKYLEFLKKLNYPILENLVYNDYCDQRNKNSLLFAVKHDKLDFVKSCPMSMVSKKIFIKAIEYGRLEILKHFHGNGSYVPEASTEDEKLDKLEYDFLSILRDLDENYHHSDEFCGIAAQNGYLDVLKYLREIGYNWNDDTALEAVCNLEILKFLLENGCPYSREVLSCAAEKGCLDTIVYLHENGYAYENYYPHRYAANNGHLNVIIYLQGIGCLWDARASENAAHSGHLDIVTYLHEHNCPWDASTFIEAAGSGNLEMIKYLHENNCPYLPRAFSQAAAKGHFEIVKYLHEHNYPWDDDTFNYAVKNGHQKVVAYLREIHCTYFS